MLFSLLVFFFFIAWYYRS